MADTVLCDGKEIYNGERFCVLGGMAGHWVIAEGGLEVVQTEHIY